MLKKYDTYVLVLIIIIGLIMLLMGKNSVKDKIKKSLGDCSYTVGTVDVYFYRAPIGNNAHFSSITYSYLVNNIKYVNDYDAMFYELPSSPKVGDKFIVAYNKKDPQKSLLLGDYPIKTEEDLEVYIKNGIKIDF